MKKISILVIASLMFCSALMFAQLTNPKIVGDIEMSPSKPWVGQNITFKFRALVKFEPADNLSIIAHIDGNKVFLKTFSGTVPAGYDEYLEFTWNNATLGNHTLTIDIDPGNIIQEEDETDNHLEKTFKVTYKMSVKPSYTLTQVKPKINPNFQAKPLNIFVEPTIKRNVTSDGIKHIWTIYGLVKSEFHDLDELTVDLKIASSTHNCKSRIVVKDLKAGQSKIAGMECELPFGSYVAVIVADPDNVLKEENRSDNTRIRSLDLSFIQ